MTSADRTAKERVARNEAAFRRINDRRCIGEPQERAAAV